MNTITVKTENISILGDKLNIEIPLSTLRSFLIGEKKVKKTKIDKKSIIESTRGAWKRRKIDPLEYQRQIRNEWN